MLLTLNNDCLLSICKYLKSHDIISMAFTSRRLQFVVQDFYRRDCLDTTPKFWRYYEEQKDSFDKFWRLISENLLKLKMRPQKFSHMNLLVLCKLPKLKYFEFLPKSVFIISEVEDGSFKILLEEINTKLKHLSCAHISSKYFSVARKSSFPELISLEISDFYAYPRPLNLDLNAKNFPKLRTLICKYTKQDQFWTFTSLTELTLINIQDLTPQHVEKILIQLSLKKLRIRNELIRNCYGDQLQNCYDAINQCQTLEEIAIDYHHFRAFGENLLSLKKLRVLQFNTPFCCRCDCKNLPMAKNVWVHFSKITKNLRMYIGEWRQLEIFVENLTNVECLKIIGYPSSSLHMTNLTKKLKNLKNLRELYCDYTRIDISALDIFLECQKLEVFDVSNTILSSQFMQKFLDIVPTRQLPLKFRLNKSRVHNPKEVRKPDVVTPREDYSSEVPNNVDTFEVICEW